MIHNVCYYFDVKPDGMIENQYHYIDIGLHEYLSCQQISIQESSQFSLHNIRLCSHDIPNALFHLCFVLSSGLICCQCAYSS